MQVQIVILLLLLLAAPCWAEDLVPIALPGPIDSDVPTVPPLKEAAPLSISLSVQIGEEVQELPFSAKAADNLARVHRLLGQDTSLLAFTVQAVNQGVVSWLQTAQRQADKVERQAVCRALDEETRAQYTAALKQFNPCPEEE